MPKEATRTIHGYTLIRRLGEGTFGEVWEATAPGGIPAAVKLIYYTRSQAAAQLELDALDLLKKLKHAYLLPTYASFIESDQVVIAMELADGTLRQRLSYCKNENLPGVPVPELLHYVRQSADALDYLHAQKKLHRDVKPDNLLLFLGPPPYVKVGDCGLLREHADTDETMTTLGTPPYMALEVWRRTACAQSDLYSLVVTYVELRQGKRPYAPSPGVSLFDAQLSQEPDLYGLEEVEKVIVRKGLAKEPQQRHESCIEFVEELERALQVRPGSFRPGVKVGVVTAKPKLDPAAPPRPRTEREPAHATLGGTYKPGVQESNSALPTPSIPKEDSWPQEGGAAAEQIVEVERPRKPTTTGGTTWVAAVLVLAALGGVGYLASHVLFPNGTKVKKTDDDDPGRVEKTNEKTGKTNGKGKVHEDEPKPWLPADFKPLKETAVVTVGQRGKFYRTLVREYKDAKVHFHLVYPRKAPDWAPFYLMENKAWNGLYALAEKDGTWKLGGKKAHGKEDVTAEDRELPVLRITRADAEAFAQMLGGKLPSAEQLDRAAGWPDDEANGPKSAAVGRGEEGPRKVTDDGDVTWAGIRDLRGNGREWTRTDVKGTTLAELRGQRYTATGPLTYATLQEQVAKNMRPRLDPEHASPYTGFRVAVEVPTSGGKD